MAFKKSDIPIFWIPACAGMTISQIVSDRYHIRHTREGGYPIFKKTFYDFIKIKKPNGMNGQLLSYCGL